MAESPGITKRWHLETGNFESKTDDRLKLEMKQKKNVPTKNMVEENLIMFLSQQKQESKINKTWIG
ncbi:hypothetical protein TNCV_1534151, partial [Trichonephila clavipes]